MDEMANMIGYDIFFIYFSWEFSPETRTGNMHWLSERKKWCQMKSVRRDPRDVNQEKWQNWMWFVNEKDNNSFVAPCLVTSSQIADVAKKGYVQGKLPQRPVWKHRFRKWNPSFSLDIFINMSLVDFKKDYFVGSVKKAEEEISVFGISSCVCHNFC